MKRIIVTPAGRKRYLEILANYLIAYKDEFDRWDLWVNTTDFDDIDFMIKLSKEHSFIKMIPNPMSSSTEKHKGSTIFPFFKYCTAEDEIYLRLDDDIVYIQKESLSRMFTARLDNPNPFLLFGNIINNAILTHLHQRFGLLPSKYGIVEYYCLDDLGWKNPYFAAKIHNLFLENPDKDYSIQNWLLNVYERCSINVISWTGADFYKFGGVIDSDEENFLSTDKPKALKRPNMIIGNTLFVHYSFYTQREFLDSTDILLRYKELSSAAN